MSPSSIEESESVESRKRCLLKSSPIKRDEGKFSTSKIMSQYGNTGTGGTENIPLNASFKVEPLPPEINVHKSKRHKGVALVDLKPNSCRWPEGDPKDPNFHFCGEPVAPGKIYCPAHCAIAYTGIFKAK